MCSKTEFGDELQRPIASKLYEIWKNGNIWKCSEWSKLFEKIIFKQKFLDLTHKRNTVYFSCKNTKFYGLTSKSKGFCRKHLGHDISLENETLWSKDKKYDFWYQFWHLRTILPEFEFSHGFYFKCDHYSRFQDFSKYSWYSQIWSLNSFIMFWVPKTLYYLP